MQRTGKPGSAVSAPGVPQSAVTRFAADGKLVCGAKLNIATGWRRRSGSMHHRQASRQTASEPWTGPDDGRRHQL